MRPVKVASVESCSHRRARGKRRQGDRCHLATIQKKI